MDFEQRLNLSKSRVLLFMMENETMDLNNEQFIVEFRNSTWLNDIPSETITRSRRYRKSKQKFLNWRDTVEAELWYQKQFKI